ncbi:MAG: beta-galactosidase trimerization domain-containing protein [Kiritimatiellia bacterium]
MRDRVEKANGKTVDILAYPVTFMAIDGGSIREMPAEVLRLPVMPRIFWGDESVLPVEKLLASDATFKRLTLYMVANSATPAYRFQPSGRSFFVSPDGATIVDKDGNPATDRGVYVEGKYTIVVPQFPVPVRMRGENLKLLISGEAGQLELPNKKSMKESLGNYHRDTFYAYAAQEGAEVTVGAKASGDPLHLTGDFGAYPRRQIIVDATARESKEPRTMLVSLASYSVVGGQTLTVRVQFKDALDAATLTPPEVGAYISQTPVLGEDGMLNEAPGDDAPVTAWQSLRVMSSPQPDTYDISIPKLPSNVYWIRLALDRRGQCSPASTMRADIVAGVVDPAAQTVLSVFCPYGRHAYVGATDVPVTVVVKNVAPTQAAKLKVVLETQGHSMPVFEKDLPALPAGQHAVQLLLPKQVIGELSPGSYELTASLGATTANRWKLLLARPRFKEDFPLFDHGWDTGNIDEGNLWHYATPQVPMYSNVPKDGIRDANRKMEILRRNATILGQQCNMNVTTPGFRKFDIYHGRDSSSQIAEVEMILRRNLSLPAAEEYYYPNHFEAVCEVLAEQGMGKFECHLDSFHPRSLGHSEKKELDAKMRQNELLAQLGSRFENFVGMTLVTDDTTPTGDTELGDSGRTIRLQEQARIFKEKHGFDRPAFGLAAQAFGNELEGKGDEKQREVLRQWEAWAFDENSLLGDYHAMARKLVDALLPKSLIGIIGTGDRAGIEQGTYPMTAHRDTSPLFATDGSGDYGMMYNLDPLVKTRFYMMTGQELWGNQGFNRPQGFYNLKSYFAGYLAAGVKGFGYYAGQRDHIQNPNTFGNLGVREERQDIRDLLKVYGPMFHDLKPVADIGILYPFHQAAYEVTGIETQTGPMMDSRDLAYSAITQLALLGYNSEVVPVEAIDSGDFKRFKVMIAPGLHYLLPKHREALERFVADGGTLLVGARSTLVPKGARKIEDDFSECAEMNKKYGYNTLRDVGHAYLFSEARRKAPLLRKELPDSVLPFAARGTDRVIVQTSRAGNGRYTFVWSMLFPSWMGTARVSTYPETSNNDFKEANETTLMPLKETVTFPAGMSTYELFSQQPVDKPVAGGRVESVADLSFTPFRIFVSLPKPVAKLRVEAPASVPQGVGVVVKATPLDADGKPIDASVPVRMTLLDASGKVAAEACGAAFPSCERRLAVPFDGQTGRWTLQVQELVSGRRAEVALEVKDAAAAPPVRAVEAPGVAVQREELVRQFIDARKKDGESVLVLLDESQFDKRQALAGEVVKTLATLGVKAEIKRTDAQGVYSSEERVHLYNDKMNWTEMNPAQYIKHHLVLLGGEGESVLIEELQDNQLFERSLTASYPGPGRGVISLVRSPFAFGKDVLALLGPDPEGIRTAIRKLGDLAGPAAGQSQTAASVRSALVSQDLSGEVKPGTPFTQMDGAPTSCVTTSAAGDEVVFATLGYAKNLFAFDMGGNLKWMDKVGHVDTKKVQAAGSGALAVFSDDKVYLRESSGTIRWKARNVKYVDPEGRYMVVRNSASEDSDRIDAPTFADTLAVYDLNGRLLWSTDKIGQYKTTKELLTATKTEFIDVCDQGRTIVYRSYSAHGQGQHKARKATSLLGLKVASGEELVFADAMTGAEKKRIEIDVEAIIRASGRNLNKTQITGWRMVDDGKLAVAQLDRTSNAFLHQFGFMLLDGNLKPLLAGQNFEIPIGYGDFIQRQYTILGDRRRVFTAHDTVCISDTQWKQLNSVRTEGYILSMVVDEAQNRIATANYEGRVKMWDLNLKLLWEAQVGSAAQLAFLRGGKLAVGTLRGRAMLFAADGTLEWERSLNAYAEPESVEKRWAELEAVPTMKIGEEETWWERLQKNVDLGADVAGVSGTVSAKGGLEASFPGQSFGTYLVEWTHGPAPEACTVSLKMEEREKDGAGAAIERLSLSAMAGPSVGTERAILRLGDRPESVRVSILASGTGSAATKLSVRPLVFPSADLIRRPSLYRGDGKGDRANPPVAVDVFMNVDEEPAWGGPHISRWVDPVSFVNGRMLEPEASQFRGMWFGSGNFFLNGSGMMCVPCWIELTLPKKRVITHVVVAEDPTLPRVESIGVDVYIESREMRKGLTDFEKRQAQRGFWQNVAILRGNSDTYHVFKLKEPVFTKKVRVYVVNGTSSITEVELYGALPKELQKAAATAGSGGDQ